MKNGEIRSDLKRETQVIQFVHIAQIARTLEEVLAL